MTIGKNRFPEDLQNNFLNSNNNIGIILLDLTQ